MEKLNYRGSALAGVVIAVLLIVTLALSGFIVYDKFIKEDEVVLNDNVNNGNNNPVVEEKIDVVDGVSYSDSYYDGKIKVTIPKFTGSSSNLEKLNKQMAEDILKDAYGGAVALAGDFGDYGKDGFTTDYEYVEKNNIIAIYATTRANGGKYPGSGDGVKRYNYFYDIKNDKVLTLVEALLLLGYTNQDLKKFDLDTFEDLTTKGYSHYVIEDGVGIIRFIDCREGCL